MVCYGIFWSGQYNCASQALACRSFSFDVDGSIGKTFLAKCPNDKIIGNVYYNIPNICHSC